METILEQLDGLKIDDIWNQFDSLRKQDTKVQKHIGCIECNGRQEITEEGFNVCVECGLVDEYNITDDAEWSSGINEDGSVHDASRCGMASATDLFSNKWGAGTIMNFSGCKSGTRTENNRLSKINFHGSMNHKDRALFHAYNEFEEICKQKLGLSDVIIREAKIMYRKFNEEKLTRGAIRTGVKANCVFYACKINNISLTTKEIADAFEIPTKDMSRTTDMFKSNVSNKNVKKTSHTKPLDVVYRLLDTFDMEEEEYKKMYGRVRDMCDHISKCVHLMGKTPTSIAAVIILKLIDSKNTSKKEVAEKCNISLPTLVKIEKITNKYLEKCPL
jgi:transcription initiation factor TFIIIB Brf1 subunit/transcription initiation factor TFIIB